MNKIILMLVLGCMTQWMNAQGVAVEKSVWGIQAGFLGVWGYNESQLSSKMVLRSEIGWNGTINGGTDRQTSVHMNPVFSLEPRWYFNLEKNISKINSEGIKNRGPYALFKLIYAPDWLVISNTDRNDYQLNYIHMVPGIGATLGN